jgi:hypothetical protein
MTTLRAALPRLGLGLLSAIIRSARLCPEEMT